VDIQTILEGVTIAKTSLELMTAAAGLMPKGAKRDEIEKNLQLAEAALQRSDATLAKELGFKLCTCTYPPQIMLWKEAEKASVCPNPDCGKSVTWGVKTSGEALKNISSGGPNGWMGR
jgi:hypothetical protein